MSDNVTNDRKHTITHDFIVGHEYEVTVRAVGPDGIQQAMEHSARNTIAIQGKLAVPNTPTLLTATGYMNAIGLVWANPLDHDFDKMEIWRGVDYDGLNRTKIAEVRGITYIDTIGSPSITRYYWIRAVNTSGQVSGYYPLHTGVSGTTLGVVVTDIDDFAVTATKMFTKTVILDTDSWTNNSPGAGSVAWNAHNVVYNGVIYPITAGNTANAYVYWTIGNTTYSTGASHPTLGTTAFMIAINTSGIHTLVWNSSANMVIGSAFIANLAVTSAKIALATITDAQIASLNVGKVTAGTLAVGYTAAKCTNPNADQTSLNTAADTAKVQGSTIIIGGYIATAFLSATNIQTGTLTGRVVQTASSGQRAVLDISDNTFKLYNSDGNLRVTIDDNGGGYILLGSLTERTVHQNGASIFTSATAANKALSGSWYDGEAFNDTFHITIGGTGYFSYLESEVTVDCGSGYLVDGVTIIDGQGNITTNVGTVDGIDIAGHAANNDAHHNESHTHTHASTTGKGTDDHHARTHNNTYHSTNYAAASLTITSGAGMSGGGNLTANRTLTVDYGSEPPSVSSSTSGAAGANDSASRSDHSHDLAAHTHDATHGGNLSAAVITTGALNSTARLPSGGETTTDYEIDCGSVDVIQISFSNGQCTNIRKV